MTIEKSNWSVKNYNPNNNPKASAKKSSCQLDYKIIDRVIGIACERE